MILKFTLMIIVCLMFYSKIYSHVGFRHMLFSKLTFLVKLVFAKINAGIFCSPPCCNKGHTWIRESLILKFTLIIIFIVCLMFYSKIYSHVGFRHMLFIKIEYNGNCLFFTSECFLHLSMVVFEMELLRWFITILQ